MHTAGQGDLPGWRSYVLPDLLRWSPDIAQADICKTMTYVLIGPGYPQMFFE